jgi:hypothetical protein
VPAGRNVVEFGDIGNNFYFILNGSVEVNIPDQSRLERFREM